MRGPHPNNETGHIGWRLLPFNGACFSLFGCFPSSGPGCARSTFPVGEGFLRRGGIHRGLALTFRGPLHTRRLRAAPSPSRRGRGFPPAGASLTFPWGKVPPRRRMRGGTKSVLPAAPLPSGPLALTPSPGRGYEKPPPGGSLPLRGRWHAVRRDG